MVGLPLTSCTAAAAARSSTHTVWDERNSKGTRLEKRSHTCLPLSSVSSPHGAPRHTRCDASPGPSSAVACADGDAEARPSFRAPADVRTGRAAPASACTAARRVVLLRCRLLRRRPFAGDRQDARVCLRAACRPVRPPIDPRMETRTVACGLLLHHCREGGRERERGRRREGARERGLTHHTLLMLYRRALPLYIAPLHPCDIAPPPCPPFFPPPLLSTCKR